MRIWIGTCVSLVAIGLFAAAGCGDDSTGGEGGTTTTSSSGTGGTASGGGGTGGGTGGSGNASCTEVTSDDFTYLGSYFGLYYGGSTNPPLGGADEDAFSLEVWSLITGTVDLGSGDNAGYDTCSACFLVYEDMDVDGNPARTYFQKSGTLELGDTEPYYLAGSFQDVTLVEVTIDPDTYQAIPVVNGACLHVTDLPFAVVPPADGWVCDPNYYDEESDEYCDCECGAVDPDCSAAYTSIYPCYEGQTCNDQAMCEGVPSAWTCDANAWEDGTNCDCGCGVPDPDCEDTNLPVLGCTSEETCTSGVCLPNAWTCDPGYYGASDGCDCECGAPDPDCEADATNAYGCEDTNLYTGTCLPDGTCEPV